MPLFPVFASISTSAAEILNSRCLPQLILVIASNLNLHIHLVDPFEFSYGNLSLSVTWPLHSTPSWGLLPSNGGQF